MTVADRVAAEHLHWPGMERCRCGVEIVEKGCGCNQLTDAYTRHIAQVTEAAVRAYLHMRVREARDLDLSAWSNEDVRFGGGDAYDTALRKIAGG